jgi:pilus assembly protein Flp/PilA
MKQFVKKIVRFLVEEEGPTAVEYAMMLMFILLACLTVVATIGQTTSTSIQHSYDAMDAAISEH